MLFSIAWKDGGRYIYSSREGEGWRFSPGCRSARIYFSKVLFLLSLPPSPSLARLLFCRIKFTQRNNIFTSTRLPNSLVERAESLYFPCLRCRPLQELSCPVPCSREFEDVKASDGQTFVLNGVRRFFLFLLVTEEQW